MAKVALITGVNGITGSAILEHLVKHTTVSEWSRIVITSRSPLKMSVSDSRVEFIALDFSNTPEELAGQMRDRCADVTHAYFSSYVHKDTFVELNSANRSLFENFLSALTSVAKSLQNCTLQTGGKYYNVHLCPVPWPTREEDPRLVPAEENFYYHQEDFLAEQQHGSNWTWNVIRPEAIIGCTSKPNGMNEALTIALYFLINKELGLEAPMPTNFAYFNGVDDVSDAKLIADLSIFASTHENCANQAFNVANGDVISWKNLWPRLADWFGCKVPSDQKFEKTSFEHGETYQEISLQQWAKDKRGVWEKLCDQLGSPESKSTFDAGTWAFQDWVYQRTWSSPLSINKARKFGWTGHLDSFDSFTEAFTKFKELKQIP
ncbi:nucleoside-diphosphate-sugar epimerase GsfE [Penicillium brasilianum]|uniref:Nucleoside-diphosphate-sugar epimerase GsfE n=1 Tax=Penicillium brasilianum TaxID=104259 RepID=A0A1S9RW28_PENBI|nr:nucleoside-diphosphate-sugar epimerase GsfE [Penicillium brasilianum]